VRSPNQIRGLAGETGGFSRIDELASQKAVTSDIMKKFKVYKHKIGEFINESNQMMQVKVPRARLEQYDRKDLIPKHTLRRNPKVETIELNL
jgi:hypothetical protein